MIRYGIYGHHFFIKQMLNRNRVKFFSSSFHFACAELFLSSIMKWKRGRSEQNDRIEMQIKWSEITIKLNAKRTHVRHGILLNKRKKKKMCRKKRNAKFICRLWSRDERQKWRAFIGFYFDCCWWPSAFWSERNGTSGPNDIRQEISLFSMIVIRNGRRPSSEAIIILRLNFHANIEWTNNDLSFLGRHLVSIVSVVNGEMTKEKSNFPSFVFMTDDMCDTFSIWIYTSYTSNDLLSKHLQFRWRTKIKIVSSFCKKKDEKKGNAWEWKRTQIKLKLHYKSNVKCSTNIARAENVFS